MEKKILIIEDEMALRMALEEKFLGEGFDVIVADNGEDGLDLARQHDQPPCFAPRTGQFEQVLNRRRVCGLPARSPMRRARS